MSTVHATALAILVGQKVVAYTKVGHGPPVVIIHGIGAHKEDWADLASTLAGDHAVFAIDMLGFGGSSKIGEAITIADQVAATVALMDAEKLSRADIVGNSVGGWVAATLASLHPDRVDRLVLVDAAGFEAMFEGESPVNFYPSGIDEMMKLLSYVRFDPTAHTAAFAQAALAASIATGDAQASDAISKGMFVSDRLEDVGDKVFASTLVIWGAEDKLFLASVADLVTSHLKVFRKVIIPSAGHFPQLDNPTVFNATVADFLKP